jgi:hypothetical protein
MADEGGSNHGRRAAELRSTDEIDVDVSGTIVPAGG